MHELPGGVAVEPVDPGLLLVLLQLDERIKAGQVPLDPPDTLEPQALRALTDAAGALLELEAQYPRRPVARAESSLAGHPERVGRFRIDRVLGCGGCAVVYRAHDELLDRRVAIKVPRFHALASAEVRRRFVREAHAAAQLDHSHIVPIYEAGEFHEIPYIAYALCDGPTLGQWVKQSSEPMDPSLAARLMRELAEAVQYSHDQGILHRDIKPSNVLLFPQNPPEDEAFPFTPRLSDLGLAKLIESELEETTTDVVMGTPLFMSPEQADGRPADVGPASDVYSLGAVLFFLVTGRPPFVAASLVETLNQVIEQDPISPSVLNPAVDRELNTICLKCLEKTPACRYANARALAEDLRRYLAGVPILARPASWSHRARRWCQRNPLPASLGGGVVCLICGLIGSLAWNNTTSRALGRRLQAQNLMLQENLRRLDAAYQSTRCQREWAEESRRRTEQLLYSTDLQAANQAWRRSDPREAARILRQYPLPDSSVDFREFTWYFLRHQLTGTGQVIGQANEPLWHLGIESGSGCLLGSGGRGGLTRWDPTVPGIPLWRVESGQGEVNATAFSADGKTFASAGDDGRIGFWDTSNGRNTGWAEFLDDGRQLYCVGLLSSPPRWVTGGRSSEVGIFDEASRKLVGRWTWTGQRAVECLAVAPDGKHFATGGAEGGVAVWRGDGPSPILSLVPHRGPCSTVCFSRDGRWLYSAGGDGRLLLHDIETGRCLRQFHRPDSIHSLAISSAGSVACGDRGGVITLLAPVVIEEVDSDNSSSDSPEWPVIAMWAASESRVTSLTFNSEDILCAGDSIGHLKLWQLEARTRSRRIPHLPQEVDRGRYIVVQPGRSDDEFLRASGSGLEAWNLRQGRLNAMLVHDRYIATCRIHSQATTTEKTTTEKSVFVGDSAGNVGEVGLASPQTPKWWPVFEGVEASVVVPFPRSRRVIAISNDSELADLDLETGQVSRRIEGVSAVCVSPREDWAVMTFHGTNRICLVDPQSLQVLRELMSHQSTISALCATPDGSRLVVASHDRTAVLWDTQTWSRAALLLGHAEKVTAIAISPDGQTIATGDGGGTVRLWQLACGRELAEIPLGATGVRSLTFASDATALIVGRNDGDVEILVAPR